MRKPSASPVTKVPSHGTLVWAQRQEAGKGRRGRQWVSPEGNVYASLILRPECATATAAQLSFVAAGALADALQPLLPEAVCCCKWPNDVLIDDRKVAGILLELETDGQGGWSGWFLGIGINVQHFPPDTQFPATSLRNEGGGWISRVPSLSASCRLSVLGTMSGSKTGLRPSVKAGS